MANLSNLKSEIANVKDIGKITSAMELVATAKLKRVAKRVNEIKAYVTEVYQVFNEIISSTDKSIFLANPAKKIAKTLWIVINSNLGLAGGYNSNINKMVLKNMKPQDEILAIGGKAVNFFKENKKQINGSILDVDVNFTNDHARKISVEILAKFTNEEFDEIQIAYTKFINNVTFEPTLLQLFPIVKIENSKAIRVAETIFEPSAEEVLEASVMLYINTIIFGTIIESQVSEQASRRMAMENATKNGKELSDNLSIVYNRKRQNTITQEITEIVSGANAQNDK
ncbi:F0F1 ATP synthase subunit gamma [Spiroplasma sabaudiense Ar-1343]|uniref:ATP synthase gamma chain n=1 Tax=Spiroplasma sabaudiense Ar-1343 TaxID=1276257 RepID=W6A997_9MOLU|nr:ATP synthase F1 subunit gamma [Spiroplasma sabaudiense]AHI53465.1 F0F1 ATP synthase subunit gamma [Spiroplasma sabaudiense Ar-1343]